jgi:hypothetical protein
MFIDCTYKRVSCLYIVDAIWPSEIENEGVIYHTSWPVTSSSLITLS